MTTPATTLGILGATGRMGQRLLTLAPERGLRVAGAYASAGDPELGGTLGGVTVTHATEPDGWPGAPDVVIDFSLPDGTRAAIPRCVASGTRLVIGTTGLSDADHAAIDDAARSVAILQAPNMSLGVNLLIALAGRVAATLHAAAGDAYDVELVDVHHKHKRDAPSGTALALLDAVLANSGRTREQAVFGREGESPRTPGDVAVHALRMGSVVGDHDVHFASEQETITLRHHAATRDVFALGALTAAAWIADKPAGRYTMPDVLGLG